METKILNVPFEIKSTDEDSDFFSFSGYASTFGNKDLGGDVVVKGAFIDSLKERMPMLLWQHKTSEPIGVFVNAYEDSKGLFVEGKMPKADDFVKGRVIPQMKIGSIKSMSIGYSIKEKEIVEKDGVTTWFLKKLDLYEASLVSIPMNPMANITGMKSIESIETLKDINNYLKECGFSNQQTETLMAKMRNIIRQGNLDESKSQSEIISQLYKSISMLKI